MKKITLEAKTHNQAEYIRTVYEHDVTIVTGPAGCGKTLIATYIACKMLSEKTIQRIIICRPLVYSGSDIGALKGSLNEKIMPHFWAIEDCIKQFFTAEEYYKLLEGGAITYQPLELMRGATYHNSFMILTEAQNADKEQIKMFITRMGTDSKVVVEGDADQTDLRNSGLQTVLDKLHYIPEVGIARLNYSDIQRNKLIVKILEALK